MADGASILVVDDETGFRENVVSFLKGRGYEVMQAEAAAPAAMLAGEHEFSVALVDINMPGKSGLELLAELKRGGSSLEVIIITGEGTVDSAVEAMRLGAFHYITKPVRLKELELVLQRALEKSSLVTENQLLQAERTRLARRQYPGVVAESDAMQKLLQHAQMMAQSGMPILIHGETGTGKEVLAEFIHSHSDRKESNLVVVNCGALSENLMDAELFGHEKGAFTGAAEMRRGMIEVAERGTLFLDEIGDIPPAAQVRILRFLEQGVVRRVGSTKERKVDARVVAATHKDLEEAVAEGSFREDLFHRLRGFALEIPPLRERTEDIPALARHFLERVEQRDSIRAISPEGERALMGYGWPGNVRELAHTIQRAAMMAAFEGAEAIQPGHLGLPNGAGGEDDWLVSLKEAEMRHVERVLDHFDGNRQQAATTLGVSERHLYRLIKQLKEEGA